MKFIVSSTALLTHLQRLSTIINGNAVLPPFQREFNVNLSDWYLGGPKEGGWTRTGPRLDPEKALLLSCTAGFIHTDEGLSKNWKETDRWHLSFLRSPDNLFVSDYYNEYLKPRYNPQRSEKRANDFLKLLRDVSKNGVKDPVWVADVTALDLGFRYFRFNGCHRLCCAKVLGIQKMPALIFDIKVLSR